ncbi:sulfide dehydrogenase [Thioalkalivibrio denitrificans]|uniref:Sulfide dehydrogenase n=1 Tax=Thioalkalivibrio denitrificans TaxID=108003 RepID=A0A1V3NVB9_9GAMM|nr:NAD(P)/FAD-dependent oxidoreductase [Thioalkalivibrio denitrificans]OOG28752.1 sulfide dehydrogenase [Thioalkalivibrio denitrificans]
MTISRRKFLQALGAGGAASALAACAPMPTEPRNGEHIVVVGGGSGGATAAKYLRRFDPNLQVTLVEPNATYHTCYGSNWVLGGFRQMDQIAQSYQALRDTHGINVIQDRVTAIEPDAHQVRLAGGRTLSYQKLVLSPGIDFDWEAAAEGTSEATADRIPHAWKAGPQTQILRRQLEAMPNGGVFIMVAPPNPFRCPPGPYERASMVAHYFKTHKPRSKVLILDVKEGFSKQGLFMGGWEANYGDMIEWVGGDRGGMVNRVDVANRTVFSDDGLNRYRGDVINYIPPQKAAQIAHDAGLTNEAGWCPVDQRTFASSIHPDVHVIGDSSVAGAMPKSGHSANSQGKLVAAAIVNGLRGIDAPEPSMVNTCYSLITPDWGISVAAVYRYDDGSIRGVEGSGGVSPADADREFRRREADYTRGWYRSITTDIWG